jgi:hypothetical protein
VSGTFSFTAGLIDSIVAGASVIPSVDVSNGVFRVPLISGGSGGKVGGVDRKEILRALNRVRTSRRIAK